MDIELKKSIDEFIKNNEDEKTFNAVLDRVNEFFLDFAETIENKCNNAVNFRLNLINDYYLGSNFGSYNPVVICIDYFVDDDDLKYSENRKDKGNIGKIYADMFNVRKNIVPTLKDLYNSLYQSLTLWLKNEKIYYKKDIVAFTYLNYRFVVVFKPFENKQTSVFELKNKKLVIDLDKAHANLIQKNDETDGKFVQLIKLYKMIELELSLKDRLLINASKNLYYYENLLYNVPNELIDNEYSFDNLISSLAYLKTNELSDLITADERKLIDDNYTVKIKPNCTTIDFNKTIKQAEYFVENIDKIVNLNNN